MTEFTVPKSFDDIEEGKIAADGVYRLMSTKPPYQAPNKAGTGQNILIDFIIVDDPEAEGIGFTKYLALPNPSDAGKKTKRGQSMVDFKMERIMETVELLGGEISGNTFSLPDVCTCKAKIITRMGDNDRPFNDIEGDLMPDTDDDETDSFNPPLGDDDTPF